jgi:alpha-D-xyloside xylohydrolase
VLFRSVGDEASWPHDYRYELGNAILVAPILDDSGKRSVALPAGSRWFSWWDEAATPLEGGQTLADLDFTDRARVPVFVMEGAILVADVKDGATRLGTSAQAGALTVFTWPAATTTTFTVFEDVEADSFTITAKQGELTLGAARKGAFVQVFADAAPTSVTLDGVALTQRGSKAELDGANDGFVVVPGSRGFWVRVPAKATGAVTLRWS